MKKLKEILLLVLRLRCHSHETSRTSMPSMYVCSLIEKTLPTNDFHCISVRMLFPLIVFYIAVNMAVEQSIGSIDLVVRRSSMS